MQPESRLSHRIAEAVREEGWFIFKVHGGAMMMAGLPDLFACVNGHVLAMETKLPKEDGGKDPRPRQEYVMSLIRAAGGVAVVVRSVEDAVRHVRALAAIPAPTTPAERR